MKALFRAPLPMRRALLRPQLPELPRRVPLPLPLTPTVSPRHPPPELQLPEPPLLFQLQFP
jgi:hypothetical protein